jgi:hypothetical protein
MENGKSSKSRKKCFFYRAQEDAAKEAFVMMYSVLGDGKRYRGCSRSFGISRVSKIRC